MLNPIRSTVQVDGSTHPLPVLQRQAYKTCHIQLPDTPEPISAIVYANQFYSYVRFYSSLEATQRASERLIRLGNQVVLTQVPKGLVLWVFEPDAQLVSKK
jgi:hypothetical protein